MLAPRLLLIRELRGLKICFEHMKLLGSGLMLCMNSQVTNVGGGGDGLDFAFASTFETSGDALIPRLPTQSS